MADFMRVKYENPRLKQSEITNQLGDSTNTLGRNGNEIIMLSPCRVQSNNTKKRVKLLILTLHIVILTPKDLK